MRTFKEYVNEAAPKMATIAKLVKFLSDEKNWDEYKDAISDFFERGYDKDYGVSYEILDIMLSDDSSYQDDYGFAEKKSTWSTVDKRLRGTLKKMKKEYIIDKSACYKELKKAIQPDGEIFDDICYAIQNKDKNAGVQVKYPELKSYRDAENFLIDYDLPYYIKEVSKDDLCLIMQEGIESISIVDVPHDEQISVSGRTSSWTSEFSVTIVTYSTQKPITFKIQKTDTHGL